MHDVDVVIVGSGIAGAALARSLVQAGLRVLVLERETEYRDKVRGENMLLWGVREVHALGIESILLEAGGHYVRRMLPYDELFDEAEAQANAFSVDMVAPDAPGFLDVGHPQACAALTDAAQRAGARVLRGVESVRIEAGERPSVTFVHDAREQTVGCRFIVGADGRQSIVRKQLGLHLTEETPRTFAAGLLVHDLFDWPNDHITLGTAGDVFFLVFPRGGGIVRLYLLWDVAQRARFAGEGAARRFLDAYRIPALPAGEAIAAATPAGPCATYPMNDAHMERPFAPGAALIGDAAGWNDPIIGQGLSIALRDARMLRDILLETGGAPGVDALQPYADERKERLRRLRFSARVATEARATFSPQARERRRNWYQALRTDPLVAPSGLAPVIGPELMPAEGFTDAAYAHILAL